MCTDAALIDDKVTKVNTGKLPLNVSIVRDTGADQLPISAGGGLWE
jgi:hypothetical protein